MKNDKMTADYAVVSKDGKKRYQFFCDLSEAFVCQSDFISADTPEKELMKAWEEFGKANFNYCHKCGKWVIDAMYNPDVLTCVQCTPIEEYPEYCPQCGAKTQDPSFFCHMCGFKLLYGGDGNEENSKSD